MPDATASVSAAIAAELELHAADVFALMGNGNAWFLDAVVRRGAMTLTAVRHEAATIAAADAYHRASGRLAVASVTYGPGYTNAITPLAEAALARIPLVVVVGDRPTGGARPFDVDQAGIATAVGAPTIVVGRGDARAAARRAVETALAERRPVVLAIPYDLSHADLEGDGEAATEHASVTPFVALDAEQLAGVAERLVAARRPLLLAGRGAHLAGAEEALRALAARLGARTATSALGSGIFADASRHLGICGGFASERAAEAIEHADAVLVVGASLNAFQTRFGDAFAPDAHVMQVDILDAPSNPRVDELVRGDARLVAQALLALIGAGETGDESAAAGDAGWGEAGFAEVAGIGAEREPGDDLAADGRLDPRSLFHALERVLPEDRVIVQDGGHFIGWAPTHLSVADPERLLMVGTAFQTIGLGLPSAVGAGAARPESTIVLVTGDGGALMGLADLDSVVRTVRRGIVIVCNDAAYGAEVHQYAVRGVAEEPMLIEQVDFAALGRALGAEAAVIERLEDLAQLEAWLAIGADGVFVADCRISQRVVAPYIIEVREAAMRAAAR
ncbi:thiamine pyrophosphate-dependent acetolactate synthase large subunit-like protein [Agrococcus sp. UYP10]|uniref:thiamine pyrophosphate-binding protein n=1 Tax=Agrococcus sp. UYP10 TaxID=1756355 RepID=UPI0033997764